MFDSGLGWVREVVPAPASSSPAELVDAMAELHRLESVLVERKLAMIAALSAQRDAEGFDQDVEGGGRWAANAGEIAESEVGAALTVGRHRAGTLLSLGVALRDRLPRVRAAMAAGEVDLYRVGLIEDATRNVTPELIGEVERQILDKIRTADSTGGGGLTGRRLSNVIARIVGRLDPAGVRARRRRATEDRHVGISAAEDAMVTLFGSLPAADGRKLDVRLRELAATVCRCDPRTLEQRKADAVAALTDGLDYVPCACGRADCPQQDPGTTESGYTKPGGGTGRRGARVARKPLVHVIMLDSTLRGADAEPGYLDGYGLIDADTARDLAADADIAPVQVPEDVHQHRCQDAGTDPTAESTEGGAEGAGEVADLKGAGPRDPDLEEAGCEDAEAGAPRQRARPLPDSAYLYRPSAVLDTWIRVLGGMCQWLHCDAPAWHTDLDHDTPFNHRDPQAGGATTAAGMKPFCRTHHRIRHSSTWAQRHNPDGSIDLISPTGHHYHAPSSGYLNLLGIHPDRILNPATPKRRRRTRTQNQAARIRAERRHQQTNLDLAAAPRSRPHPRGTPGNKDQHPEADDCPF